MRGAALLRLLAAAAVCLEERGVQMDPIPDEPAPPPREQHKRHQGAKERARRLKQKARES